ncbi:MAG TPA: nuclear transport factor 2 family protein [Gemmatimonadales bacterium]|nr:nuclear transport factor 2 family protein [Gemmatimonadales bacterium]
MSRWLAAPIAALLGAAPLQAQRPIDSTAVAQVRATEVAFAKTMADRDHAAFTGFVAEEAIFFTGPEPLRGRAAVAAGWKRFFERPEAPFSWSPDTVEVLATGDLALTTGPVLNPAGVEVGRFNSIWRRVGPGVWKVVFDKGS